MPRPALAHAWPGSQAWLPACSRRACRAGPRQRGRGSGAQAAE